ncbi:Hint domain-containing protein [Asaia sp. As-1742]|uniref:Hint domain-containing protein n=1 Tax=Asaia sp. As-1742 TaxID=2608325 RepID=UPI001422AB23|nr:Hint domain-containing protein [Asaia sp. As-1742]NIE80142.1 hypothetical protein [Asaia sp. As-1742]
MADTTIRGVWSAVNVDGNTVFKSGATIVQPPVSPAAGTAFYIQNGAVVSGLSGYAINVYVSNGGMMKDSTIVDGGLTILSGGVTMNNTLNSIPSTIYSGGTTIDDNWYNSGYGEDAINIYSGATISSTTCGNGAVMNIQSGVTIYGDVTVSAGGNLTTYAGFGRDVIIPTPPSPSVGTSLQGVWSAVAVNGGTVYQSNGVTVRAPVALANGATIYVKSGAVASNLSGYAVNIYVSAGGIFESSYIRDGGMTVYSGGISRENLLNSIPTNIYSGGYSLNDTWYNSGYGNDPALIHSGAIVDNPQIGSGGAMSGAWGAVINTPAVANGGVLWANHTSVTACFLRGAQIQTRGGEIAVEDLVPGDEIACLTDGEITYRPVKWVGCEPNHYIPHESRDRAGYPIRIRAHALAENVPHSDLLITAEHCLHLDGCFVPARMLVNDISIHYEMSRPIYHYHHIELDGHAVILANGVATESYLDTGHDGLFVGRDAVKETRTWSMDGAAKLNTSRSFVEPLFYTLRERALDLFGSEAETERRVSYEMDVRLTTASGKVLRPVRKNGQTWMFMLPAYTHEVRITSRAGRPCDVMGPFVDDRRRLGLRIGAIQLHAASKAIAVTNHLTEVGMRGWHEVEDGTCRWTDGMAHLPLDVGLTSQPALLSLTVLEMAGHVEFHEMIPAECAA